MARKLKKKKMRNTHFRIWIWQENRKTWKKRKAHFRTWNMRIGEYEKHIL
jgi:hypothetical protein